MTVTDLNPAAGDEALETATIHPTLPHSLAQPVADWLRKNGQTVAEIAVREGTCGPVSVWYSRNDPDHHLVVMGVVPMPEPAKEGG